MLRIADSVADCVWLAIPQATQWQLRPPNATGLDVVKRSKRHLLFGGGRDGTNWRPRKKRLDVTEKHAGDVMF